MTRFIKFIPSEKATELRKHPFAFALLCLIAEQACRTANHPNGLGIGQAHIGDYKAIGATRQQYRTALKYLVVNEYIEIVETCRSRSKKKANHRSTTDLTTEITTASTTYGTLAKLVDNSVWNINLENGKTKVTTEITTSLTTGLPRINHEQEYKNDKEEKEQNTRAEIFSTHSRKSESDDLQELPAKLIAKKEKSDPLKSAFRQFVTLTQEEHDKLLAIHGKETFDAMLDELNSWKGRTGKTYKSDYMAMDAGSWVVKKIYNEKNTKLENLNKMAYQRKTYEVNNKRTSRTEDSEPRFKAANIIDLSIEPVANAR